MTLKREGQNNERNMILILSLFLLIASSYAGSSDMTQCHVRCHKVCEHVHHHKQAHCLNQCLGENEEIQVNFTLSSSGFGNPLAIRFGRFPTDNPNLPQRMFVANQDGRLIFSDQSELKNGPMTIMMDLSSLISTTVDHFSAYAEAGFVGLELHPKFSENGRFYVFYSIPRANGTALNTPNCSFTGGYGAKGPSSNRRDFGVDRPYQPDVYSDLTVLEEYRQLSPVGPAVFIRRMLTLKHFFTNHYGINNLMFEENDKLLVSVADGGCFFDQFGVAQNRSFIAGKVISVDVDANLAQIPIQNCSTPVILWSELMSACPATYKIFTLYASGVRNMGHMAMDRHGGLVSRFITMIGQNDAEAIFRFQWESNFGWYRRGNRKCSCLTDDALIEPQCDFRQTLSQCLNESSVIGRYNLPLVTLNQDNNHVSSNAGGFVYRGHELPCSLYGAYIWGDWSTKDKFTPGFPAPFNGTLQLFHTSPYPDHGTQYEENMYGILRVGGGLLYEKNYLASWGYDKETNRLYMGVQDIIPPYYNQGIVSDRGQIYILGSPYHGEDHHGGGGGDGHDHHYGWYHYLEHIHNQVDVILVIMIIILVLIVLLMVLAIVYYLFYYPGRRGGARRV
jgi:hypothetical protein